MNPIQWFPGHMAKAKREIKENIKLVDLVIELKDARIPFSSTNPMVDEIVGNKPRLILLNKSSLADPKITKEWMDYYKSINDNSLCNEEFIKILKQQNKILLCHKFLLIYRKYNEDKNKVLKFYFKKWRGQNGYFINYLNEFNHIIKNRTHRFKARRRNYNKCS